jgi:hypothetical protein
VPGEQPATTIIPADEAHPNQALASLAEGNADQVLAALPGLSSEDLEALAVIESEARNRVTVLRAISSELATRQESEAKAEPEPIAVGAAPAKFDRAILTPQGWVVPEPHQRTTPPKA